MWPCCRSTVSESQPACAIFSAEMELGIPSQPLITAPPLCQIDLTLFCLTVSPKLVTRNGARPSLARHIARATTATVGRIRGIDTGTSIRFSEDLEEESS